MEPGSEVYVNGRQVALSEESSAFRTTISLTKEITSVTVDAVDKAGNHNTTTRSVVLDTTPPFLRVNSPAEGLITNRSSISITGEAEAGSYLTVAGNSQQLQGTAPARANFSAQVSLNEGLNTLLVTALDMAGNTNKSVIHVTLDTIAPTLSVESPLNGSSTANSTVLVEGFTEPGARLTVNGQQVLVGYTGSFSVEVRLSTGNNSITVLTQDLAGNPNEVRVGVQRVPARVKSPNATGGGPDWLFTGFLTLAAVVAASEFYIFSRHIRGLRIRVEGGG
jgi:bacillopeptidase F